MTAQQIADLVKQEADARFPEVIERLFPLIVNHHAHDSWRGECNCSYCQFIRNRYTPFKLTMHRLKKRVRYYEWCNGDVNAEMVLATEEELAKQAIRLLNMKQEKLALKAE